MGIDQSVYTPLSIPQRIDEYFGLVLEKVNAINDPFEQSFFMMVHIPYLQPFMDVNKRTSRLIANIPFIKGNFSPLSFIDMPKQDYVEAIAVARQFGEKQRNFSGENLWARGYAVSTVGFELDKIKDYIAHQEKLDTEQEEGRF